MSLIRTLLGVSRHWGDKEPIQLALTLFNKESSYPAFQPVIVQTRHMEAAAAGNRDMHIEAINLMPTRTGMWCRNRNSLYGNSVIDMPAKQVLDERRIIEIERFDYKKLERIAEFVKANGAVTMLLDGMKGAREFFGSTNNFKKHYDYTAWNGHKSGSSGPPSSNSDRRVLVISFLDLEYSMPIFSRKRADGMAVQAAYMWKDASERQNKFYFSDEIVATMNRYPDNIHQVDGQSIFKPGFIGNDYTSHLREIAVKEMRRRKEYGITKKGSKKDSGEGGGKKKKSSPAPSKPSTLASLKTLDTSNNYGTYYTYSASTTTTYS